MELSEKYQILFTFQGDENPGIEYIRSMWEVAVKEEYEVSGIYVNVVISEQSLVCVDCSSVEIGYVIIAVRDPLRAPDQSAYYDALGNVIFSVRTSINLPYTLITSEIVDVASFFRGM